ncbi:MAG: hypothetical protein ACYTG0_40220 [Planctomycetota bacterium]
MNAVSEAMPERYMDRDERMRDDPVWLAWYMASYEMDGAWVWLEKLRVLLEQKVGQTPCENAADKAPENAEELQLDPSPTDSSSSARSRARPTLPAKSDR